MPQTLELFWAIPACKERSACRYIKDKERIGMYVKEQGQRISVLFPSTARIRTNLCNYMYKHCEHKNSFSSDNWYPEHKYKKKNQQPETIIPIGAPNDDENRGVRLCKQVLLFVTQILTYLLTDLVNCCYSVFRFCLRPWGRNYPFISKDMFCNLRRFRVLGRKSFIRVFNCLAS